MKNLFKSLVAFAFLSLIGFATTSCELDPTTGGGSWGTPVFEITGEAVVHNAVSVDIPVNAKYLTKIGIYVKEVCVESNGDVYFVEYDSNGNQVKAGLASAPSAAIIFRKGKSIDGGESLTNIHLSGNEGLDRSKTFIVYFAAAISDTQYYNNGEVLQVMFETPERYADDDVAVIRQSYEGMDVYVTIPEQVKSKGRRVKWGVSNIAMLEYNNNPPIPQMLHSCDYVYPAYLIKNDTLLEINHYNAYRRNAKGEVGYYVIDTEGMEAIEVSPSDPRVEAGVAEPIQYYYHFQPGEPLVLLLSEVDYAECELSDGEDGHTFANCDKKHPTINWHWGPGWYWFPYDWATYARENAGSGLPDMGIGGGSSPSVDYNKYWNEGAWYRQINLRLPGPEKFNGTVNVEVTDVSTKNGKITFTPDNQTFMYLVGIFEDTNEYLQGFIDITRSYLDGDESLWQWFTTSEMSAYFGIRNYYASEGPQIFNLNEYFATLTAGKTYHIVVNAMGKYLGDDGKYYPDVSAQNYQHIVFTLKEYTLPEPELEVTAMEPFSPWKVGFTIKNPNWQTNPVSKVSFVANYTRDFDAYMKANNFTYTDMVMMNSGSPYYQFSDSELELVNSPAGFYVEFDVFENSEFTAAFMGWNSEGRPSNPDSTTTPGYAKAKSTVLPPATALDMTKLNALKGDWTATATVNVYNSTTGEFTQQIRTWKVSIGELEEDKTLTEAEYSFLEGLGISREVATASLNEYNDLAKSYNEGVLGQNRILCQGWKVDDQRNLSTASPWDLFLMEDYGATSTSHLFYDFGPKWFLQTNAKGEIFIPVNYNRIAPLTRWYNGSNHYLCGANYMEAQAMIYDYTNPTSVESVSIPVEISEDGNSVVLKPYSIQFYEVDENGNPKTDEDGNIIYTPVEFYPNVVYESNNQLLFYNSHVISEVLLTRGWTEATTASKLSVSKNAVESGVKVAPKNIKNYTTPTRSFGTTPLAPQQKKVEGKVAQAKMVTPEETRKGMAEYMKRLYRGQR